MVARDGNMRKIENSNQKAEIMRDREQTGSKFQARQVNKEMLAQSENF